MNIQRQILLILIATFFMLLPVCADQGMTDCLAVIVGKSNGETTFGFWYKKHQEFTGVEEHL